MAPIIDQRSYQYAAFKQQASSCSSEPGPTMEQPQFNSYYQQHFLTDALPPAPQQQQPPHLQHQLHLHQHANHLNHFGQQDPQQFAHPSPTCSTSAYPTIHYFGSHQSGAAQSGTFVPQQPPQPQPQQPHQATTSSTPEVAAVAAAAAAATVMLGYQDYYQQQVTPAAPPGHASDVGSHYSAAQAHYAPPVDYNEGQQHSYLQLEHPAASSSFYQSHNQNRPASDGQHHAPLQHHHNHHHHHQQFHHSPDEHLFAYQQPAAHYCSVQQAGSTAEPAGLTLTTKRANLGEPAGAKRPARGATNVHWPGQRQEQQQQSGKCAAPVSSTSASAPASAPNATSGAAKAKASKKQQAKQANLVRQQTINGTSVTISRRKNATRETTAMLKDWLDEHGQNPYPTKGEKIMLSIITKMSLTQVSTWFANARRRMKKENRAHWIGASPNGGPVCNPQTGAQAQSRLVAGQGAACGPASSSSGIRYLIGRHQQQQLKEAALKCRHANELANRRGCQSLVSKTQQQQQLQQAAAPLGNLNSNNVNQIGPNTRPEALQGWTESPPRISTTTAATEIN